MHVTDTAFQHLETLRLRRQWPDIGLRFSVKAGGCQGFQYDFSLISNTDILPTDHVQRKDDVFVAVDETSWPFVSKGQLTYHVSGTQSKFLFSNTQASQTCGCGQSFQLP